MLFDVFYNRNVEIYSRLVWQILQNYDKNVLLPKLQSYSVKRKIWFYSIYVTGGWTTGDTSGFY